MNIEDIQEMKQDLEKLISKSHKIEGAMEEVNKQIKEKYHVGNWQEGQDLVEKMMKREKEIKEELTAMINKFKGKWEGKINGYG